jgi:4-amino-4-deoxy-L-arabinose transferase-like glycosyltransferase
MTLNAAYGWENTVRRPWMRLVLPVGLLALLVHGLMLLPVLFPLQTVMGLIWAGAVPGVLGLRLLLADDAPLGIVERAPLAVGLGYVSIVLGTLGLQFLRGPLTRTHLLIFYDALVLALVVLSLVLGSGTSRSEGVEVPRRARGLTVRWLPLLVLILAAGFLRLANLGYSEFQGDEVAVLDKARALLQGSDDALFLHKKGPAEILLTTLTYASAWRINEAMARLPFAVANLCGVVGLYALGRRAFSQRAGWWAALLVALNGFLVAFGRIVQYQSLVFLFSVLGLLCALRFRERLDRRYLWLCALFIASGLLAHSDTIFAAAAAAVSILGTLVTRRVNAAAIVRWLAGPVLMAGVVLAAFYVPFVLHPHFRVAQEYVGGRTGQPPYNNLYHSLTISTAYNAIYYLALMGMGLVSVAMNRIIRISRPPWLLPVALLGLLALSSLWPGLWHAGDRDLVGLMFLVLVLAVFLSAAESPPWQVTLLWFGLPFLVYVFLFRDPRTHLYVLFPGASLLCGVELDRLVSHLKHRAWLLNGIAVAVLAVSAAYVYVVFISHTPEYKRTYPTYRARFFWAPYGDTFPKQGLFGFPYRAGWKAVGYLYATGVLHGGYGTNEETHITRWYIRDQPECDGDTRYYFLAENVQDVQSVPMDEIASSYELVGRIWVGDEVKLRMYERRPARLILDDYRVEATGAVFDRQLSGPDGPDYPTGLSPLDPLAHVQNPAQLRLGSAIEFLGHSVDTPQAHPGETLGLTLYWRATSPITESYTVFTHVEDPGVVWGQKDGIPRCGHRPTNEWETGYVNVDHYTFALHPETPPGPHALVAGMYRADTGERLAIIDATGAPQGTTLNLGTIDVVPPGGG